MLPGDVAEKFPLLLGTFRFILKTPLKRTLALKTGNSPNKILLQESNASTAGETPGRISKETWKVDEAGKVKGNLVSEMFLLTAGYFTLGYWKPRGME